MQGHLSLKWQLYVIYDSIKFWVLSWLRFEQETHLKNVFVKPGLGVFPWLTNYLTLTGVISYWLPRCTSRSRSNHDTIELRFTIWYDTIRNDTIRYDIRYVMCDSHHDSLLIYVTIRYDIPCALHDIRYTFLRYHWNILLSAKSVETEEEKNP